MLASLIATVLVGCSDFNSASSKTMYDDFIVRDIPDISLSLESGEDTYTYYVIVESQEGHDLSFLLERNPGWISIDQQTGVIQVDLARATTGEHKFTVVVTNGEVTNRQKVTIYISKFTADLDNASPVITAIPVISARANHKTTFQVIASDANLNDVLTYHLGSMPDFMSIDPMIGLITIEAVDSDNGSYPLTVKVSDGSTATTAHSSVNVTLVEAYLPDLENNVPMVEDIPMIVVTVGKAVSQRIHARDLDNKVLTYSLREAPDWIQVDNSSGLIVATPTISNLGTHTFNAIVTDGMIDVSRSFDVKVLLSADAPDVNYPLQDGMIPKF